jgi:hypothetical protein
VSRENHVKKPGTSIVIGISGKDLHTFDIATRYPFSSIPLGIPPALQFNVSSESGNDITGVIADEENYTNWINGHQAQVYWGTQAKQTTGTLEVRLKPGLYYLVFSNKFSAFTDKQVFLEVDLNYKKTETYY